MATQRGHYAQLAIGDFFLRLAYTALIGDLIWLNIAFRLLR